IDDRRWRGYLANLTPSEFEQQYASRLPERMASTEFLERYSGTPDPVTRVKPGHVYAVRIPTAHPIHEHFRVPAFPELRNAAVTRISTTYAAETGRPAHIFSGSSPGAAAFGVIKCKT